MRPAETASLFAMAALWGGSFVFQRALVPLYGPVPLTFLRLAFAGAFLLVVARASRRPVVLRQRFWLLLGLGLLTSAVPYTLFAFGAKTLSSALLAVMNATAPMFGAVCSAVWLAERLRPLQAVGLFVGAAGVAVVSEAWTASVTAEAGLAIAAVFGVTCSALPFLLYTWLLNRVGPTRALTVTFLIPVFGALWGWAVMQERVSPVQFAGGAVILLGTYLVTRRQPPGPTVPAAD